MKILAISVVMVCAMLLGGDVLAAVTVVDNKGTSVELTSLTTTAIDLDCQGVRWHIPISRSVSLRRSEAGDLVLKTVTGQELHGKPAGFQKLEGEWELGKYSASLSDLKSVDFAQTVASPQTSPKTKPEDPSSGFVATLKTVAGATVQGHGVAFNFRYYDSDTMWIPPKSYSIDDNPRSFLPLECKQCVLAIPFVDITSVTLGDKGAALVALTDKKTLDAKLASYGTTNQRFTGSTDFGTFEIPVDQIRQIDFQHDTATGTRRQGLEQDCGELKSPFQLVINTWDGSQLTLANGCLVDLERDHRWVASTSFQLRIGESTNTVSFDKIADIRIGKKGENTAELTTTAGKTFAVTLVTSYSSWFGGRLERYGPVRIRFSDVASLQLRPLPDNTAVPAKPAERKR